MADTPFFLEKLANGLIVAVETMPETRSAACGFLVRAGSRDDPPGLAGMSHFLEHMCFKGNERLTSEEINIGFDEIGADTNAQTSKDQTFYYSWARSEDVGRQIELLAEVMRPSIPADEFDVEKDVILEEIATYKDDLPALAYDFLYEKLCWHHPMSHPVLGYDETIRAMRPEDMRAYLTHQYAASNMALIVTGNVDPTEVMHLARRYCGAWTDASAGGVDRHPPVLRTGTAGRVSDRFHQQAVAIAFPSVSTVDPLDETAEAVAAILGGNNSRFFWNIYQKGLATRVSVIREEYADFGVIILVGLCEPDNAEKLAEAMRREAGQLARDGPEDKEVRRVKNHRRTMLATESEAPGYRLGQIADDIDYRGSPRTTEERLAEVDAVSADTIARYLKEYPIVSEGFLATIGPRERLPAK
ncbi:MAG: pitrilysin family protein [Phycisphaerae bacterium]|nr:pitrilysin family protein [Phycisphaerae bacterium]